jgi:hypothetical protein
MKGLAVVVVVVAALLVFGLGSAVATTLITSATIKKHTIKNVDIANGAVNSRVVANGSIASGDLSASARGSLGQLWAVVNADGTLARGRGATSSVSSCAYAATLGDAMASTGPRE